VLKTAVVKQTQLGKHSLACWDDLDMLLCRACSVGALVALQRTRGFYNLYAQESNVRKKTTSVVVCLYVRISIA